MPTNDDSAGSVGESPEMPNQRRVVKHALRLFALLIIAWITLEITFSYHVDAFPRIYARTPSLYLEFKQLFGLQRFHSQLGQDKWVIGKVFPGVADGYFVDIGAGDAEYHSNSMALEDLGWKGICIDPFPTNFDKRTCLVFAEVVYSTKGEVVKFRDARFLGGIDAHVEQWKDRTKAAPLVEFTTTTIGDILERAKAPKLIHFLSLDTEGAEYEIMRVFPFSEYTVGAFAIEHNFEEPKRQQIRELLESKGYRHVKEQIADDWYVLRDMSPFHKD